MPRINVNPDTKVQNFQAVQPAVYVLRIKDITDRNPEKNDLKVEFEHTVPAVELNGTNGEPLTGTPSGLFQYPSLATEKQGMLRALVEATGILWEDFCNDPDTDVLKGKEVKANIKVEDYQGESRNRIGRFVKAEA